MTEHVLDRLAATVVARQGADPAASYTAKLLAGGTPLAARKMGEEAVETVIAALSEGPAALANESADLLYHLVVLWTALERREGTSGIAEKNSRSTTGA